MPFTRTYNWGESLRLEAAMADGGLKCATDKIATLVGSSIGSRSTFATLFDLAEPPTEGRQAERAYLLLTALGQDPVNWGMANYEPPKGWAETIIDLREHASGWSSLIAA